VNLENQEHLVHVGAKVPAEIRNAIERMAEDGNRSVSREVRQALQEHISRAGSAENPVEHAGTSSTSLPASLPGSEQ
jgi:hypothetical protein